MKPWPRRRGGSSAAGAAYRVEADARRSLAGSGVWSEGGGDGVRKEREGRGRGFFFNLFCHCLEPASYEGSR